MNKQPKLKKEISGVGGISGSITPMRVKNDAKVVNKTSNIVKPNELTEEAYEGNLGFHEMWLFYGKATPQQEAELDELMRNGKEEEAWAFVEKVVGYNLVRNKAKV